MRVEWDAAKAAANRLKHGVRFADLEPAFFDPYGIWASDPGEQPEDRFVLVATDARGRLVTIVYTWRDDVVRIISARKATARERATYERRIRPD